jgi:hypothetical protein
MLKNNFFSDSCDGKLYDTRVNQWHLKPALREVYSKTFAEIENTTQLKATLRAGEFTSIGGYPLFFITSDGAALSFDSVKQNLVSVSDSIKNHHNDGWRVVACEVNWEDNELYCDHSGKRIDCAYGDNDSDSEE